MLSTEVNLFFQSNAFQPSAEESEYESMDEKLQDLLEAKEGVDEAAPDADLDNKYTKKRKYIRTKHGDLEGMGRNLLSSSNCNIFQITKSIPSSLEPLFVILQNMKLYQHQLI